MNNKMLLSGRKAEGSIDVDPDSVVIMTVGLGRIGRDEQACGYPDGGMLGSLDRIPYWVGKDTGTIYFLYGLYNYTNTFNETDEYSPYVKLRSTTDGGGSARDLSSSFCVTRMDTRESSTDIELTYYDASSWWCCLGAGNLPILESDEGNEIPLAFDPPRTDFYRESKHLKRDAR